MTIVAEIQQLMTWTVQFNLFKATKTNIAIKKRLTSTCDPTQSRPKLNIFGRYKNNKNTDKSNPPGIITLPTMVVGKMPTQIVSVGGCFPLV